MSYSKTAWVNNQAPAINAANLNNIEQGVFDANVFSTVLEIIDTANIADTVGLVILNKSTPFTVTLPVGVVGKILNLKNIGAGAVTVEGYSTDLIDGELNQIIYQWACMTLQCRAANTWVII